MCEIGGAGMWAPKGRLQRLLGAVTILQQCITLGRHEGKCVERPLQVLNAVDAELFVILLATDAIP